MPERPSAPGGPAALRVIEEALAQPNPFLQRFTLLKACGERTTDAAFIARWFENIGPLDRQEAEVVFEGWLA